jgi:Protein of unknown function (DUF2924)
MKRNSSRSGTRSLADELAELRGLDLTALKQRWRVFYRTEAPVHIGRALLLQAVAYRLQERVLGGLKPSTRRLLERAAEDSPQLRGNEPESAAILIDGGLFRGLRRDGGALKPMERQSTAKVQPKRPRL